MEGPHRLPHKALRPVAMHRVPHAFPRREAVAVVLAVVTKHLEDDQARGVRRTAGAHSFEIPLAPQAQVTRDHGAPAPAPQRGKPTLAVGLQESSLTSLTSSEL